jgi:hypothetical protein
MRRRRQAARGQAAGDAPVHRAVAGMHRRAAGLGQRRVEQVRADRRRRVHAEQQHQQRRHQRAAADTGQADDGADDESRKCVGRIHSEDGWYRRPIELKNTLMLVLNNQWLYRCSMNLQQLRYVFEIARHAS